MSLKLLLLLQIWWSAGETGVFKLEAGPYYSCVRLLHHGHAASMLWRTGTIRHRDPVHLELLTLDVGQLLLLDGTVLAASEEDGGLVIITDIF